MHKLTDKLANRGSRLSSTNTTDLAKGCCQINSDIIWSSWSLCPFMRKACQWYWQTLTTSDNVQTSFGWTLGFQNFLRCYGCYVYSQSYLMKITLYRPYSLAPSECPHCRWWDCVLLGFAKRGEAVVVYSWDMWGQTKAHHWKWNNQQWQSIYSSQRLKKS